MNVALVVTACVAVWGACVALNVPLLSFKSSRNETLIDIVVGQRASIKTHRRVGSLLILGGPVTTVLCGLFTVFALIIELFRGNTPAENVEQERRNRRLRPRR